MKFIFFTLGLLLATGNASAANVSYQQWCDTDIAQGLISLSANRIFGNITGLSEEEYAARKEWVENAYSLAEKRFYKLTGVDFQVIQSKVPPEWRQQCQMKTEIK